MHEVAKVVALACICPIALAALAAPAAAVEGIGTIRVASGLNRPIGLAHAPGDESRLFIFEKAGRVRILNLDTGNVNSTPFLDIVSKVNGGTSQNDERGLLGLAFHPDYDDNGYFFVKYYRAASSGGNETVVERYTVSSNPDIADPDSDHEIITIFQPFANHNGGWIDFGPDGYLYIASGDGGSGGDPQNHGQNVNTLLGAMLRIDVDNPGSGMNYGIPSDNPLVGQTGRDEIWAYGLRNPWRNSFDRETGDLYIADVGQNQWEEINFQAADSPGGENYGWRCYEGNAPFNLSGCPPQSELVFPIHVYPISGQPECAVTGGYVYRGQDIPSLNGTYFFADYCSAKIWSFEPGDPFPSNFIDRTSQLSPSVDGHNISWIASFGEDARGELYIVSQPFSSTAGAIFRVISTAPENNDCENAIAVGDGITEFANTGASTSGPDEPDACEFFGDTNIQADVWFSYTTTCTGELNVSTCDSGYAAKLGIYGRTCPIGSGEIIACNAGGCGTRAELTISVVEGQDLLLRIGGHNGATGDGILEITCEPGPTCLGDLTGDGVVDVSDLLILLGAWGQCADPGDCPADLTGDGVVDVSDLLLLLGAWGPC